MYVQLILLEPRSLLIWSRVSFCLLFCWAQSSNGFFERFAAHQLALEFTKISLQCAEFCTISLPVRLRIRNLFLEILNSSLALPQTLLLFSRFLRLRIMDIAAVPAPHETYAQDVISLCGSKGQ